MLMLVKGSSGGSDDGEGGLTIRLKPKIRKELEAMARKYDCSIDDLVRKAFGLLKKADIVKAKGNKLFEGTKEREIINEVITFG